MADPELRSGGHQVDQETWRATEGVGVGEIWCFVAINWSRSQPGVHLMRPPLNPPQTQVSLNGHLKKAINRVLAHYWYQCLCLTLLQVQTWVRSRSRLRLWLHEAGSQASGSRLRLWLRDFKKTWLRLWLRLLSCEKALASALASASWFRFSVAYFPTYEFMLEWHVLLSECHKIYQKLK